MEASHDGRVTTVASRIAAIIHRWNLMPRRCIENQCQWIGWGEKIHTKPIQNQWENGWCPFCPFSLEPIQWHCIHLFQDHVPLLDNPWFFDKLPLFRSFRSSQSIPKIGKLLFPKLSIPLGTVQWYLRLTIFFSLNLQHDYNLYSCTLAVFRHHSSSIYSLHIPHVCRWISVSFPRAAPAMRGVLTHLTKSVLQQEFYLPSCHQTVFAGKSSI